MITLDNIKMRLTSMLKNHYAFEQWEFDDMFKGKRVKEVDIDSIALLELFLVVEEGFNLKGKISDKLDMNLAMDYTVEELTDAIALAVLKMLEGRA